MGRKLACLWVSFFHKQLHHDYYIQLMMMMMLIAIIVYLRRAQRVLGAQRQLHAPVPETTGWTALHVSRGDGAGLEPNGLPRHSGLHPLHPGRHGLSKQ